MSLQIRYNRISTAGGVDPDHITARQGVSFSSAAEEGSVAQTGMIVDDTANALDYVGLRRVYAFETAAPAHNQIVWNGYLQERRIGRDPAEGQDSDVEIMGRRWDLAIADTNSLLSRRLITGADGDRGAETDIARIQWLLDSNDKYLSNPQDVWANPSAYIDTTGPIAMDASDLRGQTAFDVLNDCAQRSGKNWFAVYDEATDTVPPTNAGKYTLHYYKPEAAYYTSTLRLTNVNADADNVTTFYVHPDAILTRDPGRSYSGIYLTGDGVSLYQQSTDVANLFQRRDAAVSNPNVKTTAKATALATRYLVDAETEDDRLICRFVVAKQYVNSLREGQRFQAKFSHLPGYSSAYAYWRCLRRTVTQRTDEFYEIAIEATPSPVPPSIVQSVSARNGDAGNLTLTLPAAVTAGNLLVIVGRKRNSNGSGGLPNHLEVGSAVGRSVFFTVAATADTLAGDLLGPDRVNVMYVVAVGDEQTLVAQANKLQFTYYEIVGGSVTGLQTLALSSQPASTSKSLGSFAAGSSLQIAGMIFGDSGGTPPTQTVGTGWTEDNQTNDVTTGSHPGSISMHASTKPTVTISGGAVEWGGAAIALV